MKNIFPITLSVAFATVSLSALAHDPGLHQQKGPAPLDCSPMNDLDPSKMDLHDPLMRALYDKCKEPLTQGRAPDQNLPGRDQQIEQPTDRGGQ